jgi:hypothetical protein
MAYEKKVKEKKSILIRDINGTIYDEYKELMTKLHLDKDVVNTKIYEAGIKKFLKKYKKQGKTLSLEIDMTMQKAVDKMQRRLGLQ